MSARDLVCGAMIVVGVALCTREAFAAPRPATASPGAVSVTNLAFYRKHAVEARRVLAEIGVSDEDR